MGKFSQHNIRASRLRPDQVREMRRLYAEERWTQGQLARTFQVTVGTVGRIVRGETWQGYEKIKDELEAEAEAVFAPPMPELSIDEQIAMANRVSTRVAQKEVLPEMLEPSRPWMKPLIRGQSDDTHKETTTSKAKSEGPPPTEMESSPDVGEGHISRGDD